MFCVTDPDGSSKGSSKRSALGLVRGDEQDTEREVHRRVQFPPGPPTEFVCGIRFAVVAIDYRPGSIGLKWNNHFVHNASGDVYVYTAAHYWPATIIASNRMNVRIPRAILNGFLT